MDELSKRITMFLLLAAEAEKWGLSLKGHAKHELNYHLNEFLRASKRLQDCLRNQGVVEEIDELGESFSRILEGVLNGDIQVGMDSQPSEPEVSPPKTSVDK